MQIAREVRHAAFPCFAYISSLPDLWDLARSSFRLQAGGDCTATSHGCSAGLNEQGDVDHRPRRTWTRGGHTAVGRSVTVSTVR